MIGFGFIPALGRYSDAALFILRLALGIIFIVHGWPKLKNIKQTAEGFTMMGFKPGALWGTIAAIGETFGGVAIIIGFLAPLAGLFFSIEMIVTTIWKMAKKNKLIGGFELDMLLFAAALLIATMGGGLLSLDAYLGIF